MMAHPRYFDEQVGGYYESAYITDNQVDLLYTSVSTGMPVKATTTSKTLYEKCNAANFYSHSGRDDSEILNRFNVEGNL